MWRHRASGVVAAYRQNHDCTDVKEAAKDIIIVDQLRGPAVPCDWIAFGHVNLDRNPARRVAACRLSGSSLHQVVTPDGWRFEESLTISFGFIPTGKENKSLVWLRRENGLDVYVNRVTGREVFTARGEPNGKIIR